MSAQHTGTETQPDWTLFQYGAAGGGTSLLYIQNPTGARWTVTYDGSNRVSSITDPILRLTTLTYSATTNRSTVRNRSRSPGDFR